MFPDFSERVPTMFAGSLRIVLRWFAADAPYAWFGFATRFKPDKLTVGSEFFKKFAEKIHADFQGQGVEAGLMESFDELASDTFQPQLVHPLIREFYEHTSLFDMDVKIEWNTIVLPFGIAYQHLIARQMDNLVIPLSNEELKGLDSWLELIDIESDGISDFRCWVRVTHDSRVPVYVGAYKTYRSQVDDVKSAYVSVAFPIPGGNMTTVLVPLNWNGDGLELTTLDTRSSEAGVYFVFPHQRSFSMVPALGLSEQFHLRVTGTDTIQVEHNCFWLGVWAFRMDYTITKRTKRPPRASAAAQAWAERALGST